MQSQQTVSKNNPLAGFMRQPKIYITLPSRGKYWPPGSLAMPENEELPVYSMTARDELMFKTPDALLNGQAVVDVIQNCVPNIKNAWNIPTIDIDTILVAMRLATYGEKMSFKHTVPVINEELEFELDLRMLLDQQKNNIWLEQIVINPELVVYVKPLTYKHLTQTSIKTFETQRILTMVNDESITDEKKLEMFNNSFNTLTKVTVELVADSIYKVVSNDVEVTEKRYIEEFINNVDKDIFAKINSHISDLKKRNDLKPLQFSSTAEQIQAGAPETYEVPINFNDSDFFG